VNKRVLIALGVILAIYAAVHAEGPAGMALYFESDNEVYLLLADHKGRESQRGWATFGGGAQEGESSAETAARETEEETRGYFLRRDLLRTIKDQAPVVGSEGFALYFAQVAFVPSQRVANNSLPKQDGTYSERGPYAWIPYSELERHLLTPVDRKKKHLIDTRFLPEGSHTDWVWSASLGSIRGAIEAGALPWSKK
jgi:8-oxo-dGTP pyrophosphatase MutT (NUDIX family)